MKIFKWGVIVFMLCALTAVILVYAIRVGKERVAAQRAPSAVSVPLPVPEPVRPSRVGERITYSVKLGMLKLGESVFTQMPAETSGDVTADVFMFVTKLFRFSDTEKIFADPKNYLPVRIERAISMWPKKEKITEEYNQKAYTVTLVKNGVRDEIRSSGPLQNAILLPFSLREWGRIESGWRMGVNLPTQKFAILFDGEEKVRVPAGEFTTYHFKSEPDKFEVWVTADDAKIPVKIRGTGGVGYVMYMSEYTPPDSARKDTVHQ